MSSHSAEDKDDKTQISHSPVREVSQDDLNMKEKDLSRGPAYDDRKEELLVEEAPMTNRAKLLGVSTAASGFLFGYDIGVLSSLLIMPDFIRRFGECDAAGVCLLPEQSASLLTGLLSVGTFVGCFMGPPISDRFGRKVALLTWSVVFLIGAAIQTSSSTVLGQLLAGRLVAGLAVGALSGLCPLYLGETVPANIRGTFVSVYQGAIILAIVVSYGIGWGTSSRTDSLSWRLPIAFQLVFGAILLSVFCFVPESPRWYLSNNRTDDARRVMADVRGIELSVDPGTNQLRGTPAMERELKDMNEGIKLENEIFAGLNYFQAYGRCFSKENSMWKRTLIGVGVQGFQQWVGQNFLYYYGPVFFSAAAVSLNAYEIQFLLGAVSLICTMPALYFTERIGRRRGLMIGSVGCIFCALVIAFVGRYALAPSGTPANMLNASEKAAGGAFIAFAMFFLAFFSCFWGPIPWVLLSELFPQPLRTKCISLSSASNWGFNTLLSFTSNRIAGKIDTFVMLVFAGCITCGLIFTILFVPEVRGLTLEEVDIMFAEGVPAWKTADWLPPGKASRGTLKDGSKIVRKREAS